MRRQVREGAAVVMTGINSFSSFNSAPSPNVYYGLAGDITRAIEPHTEADPMAILATTLAAFGNVVGRSPHFMIGAVSHHPVLDVVLVGDTAKSRKGQSWAESHRLFSLAGPDWAGEQITSGLASGEGLIWEVRDQILEWDQSGWIVKDPGVEDKRLLVMEPEFGRTLRVAGRGGNTLSPVMRQTWDDGNLRVMSRNTPVTATGAHISIIGHITQDELAMLLNDIDAFSGFANRFIWIGVRRARRLPRGGQMPRDQVDRLASKLGAAISYAKDICEMRFSDAGGKRWDKAYDNLSDEVPGMVGAMLARAEAQVLRLSMIYALLDQTDKIEPPHIEAALAVWDYAKNTVESIFGGNTGDHVANRLLKAMQAQDSLTKDDMFRICGRSLGRDRLNHALSVLRGAGLAEPVPYTGVGRGRPTERWRATNTANGAEKNEKNEENIRTF